MTGISRSIIEAVYLVLPTTGSGLRPFEVHRRLDMWSLVSVRKALVALHEEGRAEIEGLDGHRRYRRAAA